MKKFLILISVTTASILVALIIAYLRGDLKPEGLPIESQDTAFMDTEVCSFSLIVKDGYVYGSFDMPKNWDTSQRVDIHIHWKDYKDNIHKVWNIKEYYLRRYIKDSVQGYVALFKLAWDEKDTVYGADMHIQRNIKKSSIVIKDDTINTESIKSSKIKVYNSWGNNNNTVKYLYNPYSKRYIIPDFSSEHQRNNECDSCQIKFIGRTLWEDDWTTYERPGEKWIVPKKYAFQWDSTTTVCKDTVSWRIDKRMLYKDTFVFNRITYYFKDNKPYDTSWSLIGLYNGKITSIDSIRQRIWDSLFHTPEWFRIKYYKISSIADSNIYYGNCSYDQGGIKIRNWNQAHKDTVPCQIVYKTRCNVLKVVPGYKIIEYAYFWNMGKPVVYLDRKKKPFKKNVIIDYIKK